MYTKEEHAANKLKLIQALRSDKYIQTNTMLRRKQFNSYSIYGVMCDVSELGSWTGYYNTYYEYEIENQYHGKMLPIEVADWTGIDKVNLKKLMYLNENEHDFEALADVIEEESM